MDQDLTLTAPDAATDEATLTDQPDGSDSAAEGSDAFTLEFSRNLTRLREERGLERDELAALTLPLAANEKVSADSIKEYERGDYRPKQPKLWGLARALDVMPIVLGPAMSREAPLPTEELLRKKTSRALRLQRLVELLTVDGRVSEFAELVEMEPAAVYAVASADAQLSEEQLEPFFTVLPNLRRAWLMRGEGEALQPVTAAPVRAPEPLPTTPEPAAAVRVPKPLLNVFGAEPPAAPSVQALSLAVPAVAGAPMYVPLGLGLVAEVDAVLLSGAGAVSGFRLLAAAGVVPALTSDDQLERLFHALRGVLDQRAAE